MFNQGFRRSRDSALVMTKVRIRDRFEFEFSRTRDKTFIEPAFQKVAYYFVSSHIPAFQRTSEALNESAINRHALEVTIHSFISGVESGKFGWSYHKTVDGFEQLKFRNEDEWQVLESTNAQIAVKKESDQNRFIRLMKKLFTI